MGQRQAGIDLPPLAAFSFPPPQNYSPIEEASHEDSLSHICAVSVGYVARRAFFAQETNAVPAATSTATGKLVLTFNYGYEVTAENGTGTLVQLAFSDKVTGNLTSISVPAAASTNVAVSATI